MPDTDALRLLLATPEGKFFDGPVTQVVAPGALGAFAMLKHHAPLIAALEPGEVRVRVDFEERSFVIDGGFLEVRENAVVILAGWAKVVAAGAAAAEELEEHRDKAAAEA